MKSLQNVLFYTRNWLKEVFIEKIRGKKIFWIKKKNWGHLRRCACTVQSVTELIYLHTTLNLFVIFKKLCIPLQLKGRQLRMRPIRWHVFQTWLNIQCLVCDYWDILNDIDTDILNRCVCGCLTCCAMDISFVY